MTNKEGIEELRELIDIDLHPCPLIYEEALNLAIKALEERPQGEWGRWIISVIQCPDCLECFHFPTEHYSMEMLKECPNCGADMKGNEHD